MSVIDLQGSGVLVEKRKYFLGEMVNGLVLVIESYLESSSRILVIKLWLAFLHVGRLLLVPRKRWREDLQAHKTTPSPGLMLSISRSRHSLN